MPGRDHAERLHVPRDLPMSVCARWHQDCGCHDGGLAFAASGRCVSFKVVRKVDAVTPYERGRVSVGLLYCFSAFLAPRIYFSFSHPTLPPRLIAMLLIQHGPKTHDKLLSCYTPPTGTGLHTSSIACLWTELSRAWIF
jgi:hypothetical protein